MKKLVSNIGILLALGLSGCGSNNDSQETSPSYFGQTPPGATPEPFAPGTVNTSQNREAQGVFGPEMKTFYFIKRPLSEDAAWNELIELTYQDDEFREFIVIRGVSEPSISPDGTKIYLKNEYVERSSDGWSALKLMPAPFDSIDIMRLSAASNGTFYFDTFTPDLDMPLRYSRPVDGKFEAPKSLGPQFGVGRYNAHPFIAPDESFVIWDSIREGGYGASDLYISYRSADGSWGPAINMGNEINSAQAENFPSVSPDGKILTFDRRGEQSPDGETPVKIFWVDGQIIKDLKSPH
jgi:hypothetical protein